MNDTEKRTREAVSRTQRENEIKAAWEALVRAKVARVNWESHEKAVNAAVEDAEQYLAAVLKKHRVEPEPEASAGEA